MDGGGPQSQKVDEAFSHGVSGVVCSLKVYKMTLNSVLERETHSSSKDCSYSQEDAYM